MGYYKEYKGLDLPQIDSDILKHWEENKVFEKSVSEREADNVSCSMRVAFGQRNAGYSPCDGASCEGFVLSFSDDERKASFEKRWLGYTRTSYRIEC